MKVLPRQILPSQGFLKPSTVAFILSCIEKGEPDKLPPAPIVRTDDTGKLIAIDGHNLIAVMLHLGREVDVHLATSADDGLPEDSRANTLRNQDLRNKFDAAVIENQRLQNEGIHSFNDLLAKYKDLF